MQLEHADVERFNRDGILFFPSLLSAEAIETPRAELPDILSQDRPETLREKNTGNVRCVYAPHQYSSAYERLMRHPSIVEPVKQLLGGEVYLHQFSINPKAAFEGEAWGWHQDYPTWLEENRMPTPRVINVGVFLDEVTEFNGPLYFILGSHTHGAMKTELDDQSTAIPCSASTTRRSPNSASRPNCSVRRGRPDRCGCSTPTSCTPRTRTCRPIDGRFAPFATTGPTICRPPFRGRTGKRTTISNRSEL
ncbi:MAG: proline hydroxylase [Rhodospirillaceae bacterium]|nr:proline hydroxylase [Rhodospirillaceae bacterium]MBT6513092.1 proline hydroxylase [Rhodospirillaceae bacterium]